MDETQMIESEWHEMANRISLFSYPKAAIIAYYRAFEDDTWHATKRILKEMYGISEGTMRNLFYSWEL